MVAEVDSLGRELGMRMIFGCSIAHGWMVGYTGMRQWNVIFLDVMWFKWARMSRKAPRYVVLGLWVLNRAWWMGVCEWTYL